MTDKLLGKNTEQEKEINSKNKCVQIYLAVVTQVLSVYLMNSTKNGQFRDVYD